MPEMNEEGKRFRDLRDCLRALMKYGREIDTILADNAINPKARGQVQDSIVELMERSNQPAS